MDNQSSAENDRPSAVGSRSDTVDNQFSTVGNQLGAMHSASGHGGDDAIGELWMRMIESYGHRWTSQYGEIPRPGERNPAMETWHKGLTGIAPRHIHLGLSKAVKNGDPWPPSLPAFRTLCQPQLADFGLPTPASAWAQAKAAMGGPNRRQNWSHPALRLAARHARKGFSKSGYAGNGHAGNGYGEHCEKRFLAAYRHLCQRVFDGTHLSAPLPDGVLPAQEPPASPEEAQHHLEQLKAMVGDGTKK